MSRSSLYEIDQNYNGVVSEEYSNSWQFSPVIWDVLLDKYMHKEIQTPFSFKKSLFGLDGDKLRYQLNGIINNCNCLYDRICWELSMQQIFFTKDKGVIVRGIIDFLTNNKQYHLNNEGVSYLEFEHITKRFKEIANSIFRINETESPYFAFKNTSVDDDVEYWFKQYDEEADEYKYRSIKDWDEIISEFVKFEDGEISFINNLDYFKQFRGM